MPHPTALFVASEVLHHLLQAAHWEVRGTGSCCPKRGPEFRVEDQECPDVCPACPGCPAPAALTCPDDAGDLRQLVAAVVAVAIVVSLVSGVLVGYIFGRFGRRGQATGAPGSPRRRGSGVVVDGGGR